MAGKWPDALDSLLRELRSGRGRLALVDTSDRGSSNLIDRLGSGVDQVISVGARLADHDSSPPPSELLGAVRGGSVLVTDIDALLAPQLQVEVLSLLRRTAQNTALIAAWPGRIAGGRVSYSLPGRGDHLDEPARDLVVLRPLDTDFPDEVPYTLERYPA